MKLIVLSLLLGGIASANGGTCKAKKLREGFEHLQSQGGEIYATRTQGPYMAPAREARKASIDLVHKGRRLRTKPQRRQKPSSAASG